MPTFTATISPIPEDVRAEMRGRSWHPDPRCPAFEALALVRASHLGYDGAVHEGELVVAAGVAEDVAGALEHVFARGFPIERLTRVDAFGGDDERSMSANNSSAFNFRTIYGTDRLSRHAIGLAIDINPVQNPYLVGDRVFPPEAAAFLDRGRRHPGLIVRPSPVIEAFERIGWRWGGDFVSPDYHHFDRAPG
jgi:poly-gamma-glutamate synthesis protein (capsule biosynthesis protein)